MYDLFISHSSHDRKWAERLYTDLTESFRPLRVFWDRESIPAGAHWRTLLTDANVETTQYAIGLAIPLGSGKTLGASCRVRRPFMTYSTSSG